MFFQQSLPERRLPRMAACLVGTIACIALAGWIFGIPALTSIVPGLVSMKTNTALAFLMLSAALCAAAEGRWPGWQRWLAVAAAVVGSLTLFEYISGISLGIDQALLAIPYALFIPDGWPQSAPSTFCCWPQLY